LLLSGVCSLTNAEFIRLTIFFASASFGKAGYSAERDGELLWLWPTPREPQAFELYPKAA
jgi:hypothetical protein